MRIYVSKSFNLVALASALSWCGSTTTTTHHATAARTTTPPSAAPSARNVLMRRRIARPILGAAAAGMRLVHTEEVTGSIPVSPTRSAPCRSSSTSLWEPFL
jgi:hypothetical protein